MRILPLYVGSSGSGCLGCWALEFSNVKRVSGEGYSTGLIVWLEMLEISCAGMNLGSWGFIILV